MNGNVVSYHIISPIVIREISHANQRLQQMICSIKYVLQFFFPISLFCVHNGNNNIVFLNISVPKIY